MVECGISTVNDFCVVEKIPDGTYYTAILFPFKNFQNNTIITDHLLKDTK